MIGAIEEGTTSGVETISRMQDRTIVRFLFRRKENTDGYYLPVDLSESADANAEVLSYGGSE